MRKVLAALVVWTLIVVMLSWTSRAAETLPARITNTEFWRMVTEFSEPDGYFQFENFVSNEPSYQVVIPELVRYIKPGGAYLGVAPEQNFTYIAALKPQIAFIIDIRRQNMVELLLYKALFEIAPDRASFVSRLFSRKKPTTLTASASAAELFHAYEAAPVDPQLFTETLEAIKDQLIRQRGFKPAGDDVQKIEFIFNVFRQGGPRMDYAFASPRRPTADVPSYINLMVATDRQGQAWAYLASEEKYRFVRDMQQKNLIVPIVGDFAGPKALKKVGAYLKEHGAMTRVFYVSNVEDYLQASWPNYLSNLAALPQDETTTLISFAPNMNAPFTSLKLLKDIPKTWPGRSW